MIAFAYAFALIMLGNLVGARALGHLLPKVAYSARFAFCGTGFLAVALYVVALKVGAA